MEQRALSFSFAAILVVWGFEWALWLGRAAQPGLMTPLVISPGLIQTRTGAGLVGRQLATGKSVGFAGMAGIPIAVRSLLETLVPDRVWAGCMPFLEFAGRPGYKMRGAWPRIEMSLRIGRNRKSLDAGRILPIATVYQSGSQAALPCRVCGVVCVSRSSVR